jgi:hypothetical protein
VLISFFLLPCFKNTNFLGQKEEKKKKNTPKTPSFFRNFDPHIPAAEGVAGVRKPLDESAYAATARFLSVLDSIR